MSHYIMKNMKWYQIGEKDFIYAFKGADNNIFPKDYSTWHFNRKQGMTLEEFKEYMETAFKRADTKAFYNAKGPEDMCDMAVECMGDYEDFLDIDLYYNYSTYYNEDELDKINDDYHKIVDKEVCRKIDVDGNEDSYKNVKVKITNTARFLADQGMHMVCVAKKGPRNTLRNVFRKRNKVFTKLKDFKNFLKEKGGKHPTRIKGKFMDRKHYKLGRTFYADAMKTNDINEDNELGIDPYTYRFFKSVNTDRYHYNMINDLEGRKIKVYI